MLDVIGLHKLNHAVQCPPDTVARFFRRKLISGEASGEASPPAVGRKDCSAICVVAPLGFTRPLARASPMSYPDDRSHRTVAFAGAAGVLHVRASQQGIAILHQRVGQIVQPALIALAVALATNVTPTERCSSLTRSRMRASSTACSKNHSAICVPNR
jgi:hypothetical protein